MPITYDAGTNIITVTGYTESVPCTFNDLYNADKAGELSIHHRDGCRSDDPEPVPVDRSLRPADYKELGGECNDLYVIIQNCTMGGAFVRIIGIDRCGNPVQEDVFIGEGDGTYYVAKKYANVTYTQFFNGGYMGQLDYDLTQGQWGVVWKTGNAQFQLVCSFNIGNGVDTTWLADEEKQITIANGAVPPGGWYFNMREKGYVRFGVLNDAATRRTSKGCHIVDLDQDGHWLFAPSYSGRAVYLYSTAISGHNVQYPAYGGNLQMVIGGDSKIYNCIFHGVNFAVQSSLGDVFNLTLTRGLYGVATGHESPIDRLTMLGTYYGFTPYGSSAYTVKNVYARACGYLWNVAARTGSMYAVNVDADVWNFRWGDSYGSKIHRQYEFDLIVRDKKTKNPISGATVTLWDKDNNQIFQLTTDANGKISTQNVTYATYERPAPPPPTYVYTVTTTLFSPFRLRIEKVGYQTYDDYGIGLDTKTALEIGLNKVVGVFSNFGSPVINLKKSDPENKMVMAL